MVKTEEQLLSRLESGYAFYMATLLKPEEAVVLVTDFTNKGLWTLSASFELLPTMRFVVIRAEDIMFLAEGDRSAWVPWAIYRCVANVEVRVELVSEWEEWEEAPWDMLVSACNWEEAQAACRARAYDSPDTETSRFAITCTQVLPPFGCEQRVDNRLEFHDRLRLVFQKSEQ